MTSLRKYAVMTIVFMLVLAVVIFVYNRMYFEAQGAEAQKRANLGAYVQVVTAKLGQKTRALSLIGEARPYTEITLFSKLSGYVRELPVDKGDFVKRGQLIARIESPETDKDYAGAFADAMNKRAIADRMKSLREKNLVSPQDAEQADTDAKISEAKRDSIGVLKSYETIQAPFDATVTARYTDPGALVQAATASATGSIPLVRLSESSRLRVFVYLDQRDASFVTIGDPVEIRVDEKPGFLIKATISRLSGQLDSVTRMLLAEIVLDNTNKVIIPGSFVHVYLLTKFTALVEVPSEALVFQQRKPKVIVVENNVVHYRDVVVHANDGVTVQIASGLKEGDVVAVHAGSTLNDKSHVRPVQAKRE